MAGKDYWKTSWQRDAHRDFSQYAAPFFRMKSREIEVFWENHLHTVCDAGCGFGAYTLAYASNGFSVKSFDISETAVNIAKQLMRRYGLESNEMKTASILDTGYDDGAFDGVISYSVIDHMTVSDAKKGVKELLRITRKGGLILLAVDTPDEDDLKPAHLLLDDGSIQYTAPAKAGMIYHPYDADALDNFLEGKIIIHRNAGPKDELVVIIKKE